MVSINNRNSANTLTPLLRDLIIVAACLIGQAIYLVAALRNGYQGFPLDDAWIYQTYARNLAETGQWAFIPGVPSTGSTSILWTPLLVPGYLVGVGYWWTQFVGWLSLCALALGGARLFDVRALRISLAIGVGIGLSWQLIWASASGMETALFAALLLWFWVWFSKHNPAEVGHNALDGFLLGIWTGILLLARPEGVLAAGVAGIYGLSVGGRKVLPRLKWAGLAAVGFLIILIPFFGMNLRISGAVWPNTFYAKQTEYAVLWQTLYPIRFLQQVGISLVGVQALLLPGLGYSIYDAVRTKRWHVLLPLIWVLIHWALYAARLPVTYQHGRYAIPTVAILMVYGVWGMFELARPVARQTLIRLVSLVWMLSAGLLLVMMPLVLGGAAFARDVAFIETEMVATAKWLAEHAADDAIVAAHDIGAIGYFAPRRLIDLAGLVSPDVIPIMHDEEQLADFIIRNDADYLVVFPGWSASYRRMADNSRFCHVWDTSNEPDYAEATGLGSMTVFKICESESLD